MVVQRDQSAKERAQEAIDKNSADLVLAIPREELAAIPGDQRLKLIDILLNSGSQSGHLAYLWDSFGKSIHDQVTANPARWTRSFAVAPGIMRGSYEVMGLQQVFYQDVEHVANGYLTDNEKYVKDQFTKLGLDEAGNVVIGPPTAEQSAELAKTQDYATKVAAAQEAMHNLRDVPVGYSVFALPPGGLDPDAFEKEVANFTPDGPPAYQPYGEDVATMKPWAEVKKAYDDLDALIQAYLTVQPSLASLLKDGIENTSKTSAVATGPDPRATMGEGLRDTLANIGKTRPMVHTLAKDLTPIHSQLMGGTQQVDGRNWGNDPFYKTMGRDLAEQNAPGPWWQQLGLAAAEMAAFVVAGLATGGAALAIGLAAKGLMDAAIAGGKAEVMDSAYRSTLTPSTTLVTEGQVDAAKGEAVMAAASAILDVLGAGYAVSGVLKEIYQFEKVAAAAAARASAAAEKKLLQATEKEALAAAEQEAKAAAAEARGAANDARASVGKADPSTAARAEAATQNAEREALRAEERAGVLAAEKAGTIVHTKPVTVGEHTLKMAGNRIARCSDPCADLLVSLADRATSAAETAERTLGKGPASDLKARVLGSQARASGIAEQAERELSALAPTDAGRAAIEAKYLNEAALVERDVQAVEGLVQIGKLPAGDLVSVDWAKLVQDNVKQRCATITTRATEFGADAATKDLTTQLAGFQQRANKIATGAEQVATRPAALAKSAKEVSNDLRTEWANLEEALEGVEREERVRRDVRLEMAGKGGTSYGSTDTEIGKGMGITPDKPGTKPKSPDIAYNVGGRALLVADSKGGGGLEKGLTQLRRAIDSKAGSAFDKKSLDLRLYLDAESFEAMVKAGGDVGGGRKAAAAGGSWFLYGEGTVYGQQVQLLNGG